MSTVVHSNPLAARAPYNGGAHHGGQAAHEPGSGDPEPLKPHWVKGLGLSIISLVFLSFLVFLEE